MLLVSAGKPCCASLASWQLEAPLFLHLPPLQNELKGGGGARDPTPLLTLPFTRRKLSDPILPADGLRVASRNI